ncbi:SgcJ/EcaC family oxidoreductase [Streptomyces apocyni]|uniref:SgcJ/EcaC family oxidoreductase n=1 Tax=Streptomyces apocyni TaxID=2654677 RepID=UPI001E5AD708|nr:SgcJ/EcaC family oxidoreductase [Streptomyces apocyni]
MSRHLIRKRALFVAATTLVTVGTVTVGVGMATSGGGGKAAAKPTKKEIAALFDQWNAALQTGDAEKVADLYAKDAVLLPTLSPEVRTDRAGIVDYMEHFLAKKPKGEIVQSEINILDRNSAIDAGLYNFHLTDPETGEKSIAEARYTYEYEKCGGTWKIVNHHSSMVPADD